MSAGRPRKWELTELDPSELVLEKELQMRLDLPEPAEYTELLQEADGKWCFDAPIRAFLIKGKYYVVDGFTRTRAALAAGLAKVPVEYSKGSKEDAISAACGSNSGHGYRRTNRDKRRAVLVAIATFGGDLPVAKIATICAVSHTYVHSLKRSLDGGQGEAAEKAAEKAVEQKASKKAAAGSTAMDSEDSAPVPDSEECPNCGVEVHAGAACAVCQNTEQAKGKQSQGAASSAVDLVKEKTEKAKTTLGQLIRLLDDLDLGAETKEAVETISGILTAKRKKR